MLSSDELAQLRSLQEDTMPDTCVVKRKTVTDTDGVRAGTWSTLTTTVCRIRRSGKEPQERAIAERLGVVAAYTIALPYGTDVTAQDRLEAQGRVFEVAGALARSFETARLVVCKEIV